MSVDYSARSAAFFASLPASLDAFLVLTGDPWGSEYLADHWALRAHLTGFSGSAGTLLLFRNRPAVLWTDSRYTLVAQAQCRTVGIDFQEQKLPLSQELQPYVTGLQVGFDPDTLSESDAGTLKKALAEVSAELIPIPNAIAKGWVEDRPEERLQPLFRIPAPEPVSARLTRLRDEIPEHCGCLVGRPEEVAWLTHLRAFDVPCNTTPFVRLWVPKTGEAVLLADKSRVDPILQTALAEDGIRLGSLSDIPDDTGIVVDPAGVPASLFARLRDRHGPLIEKPSVIEHWKSVKSEAELAGIREALRRDAVAQAECYAALEERLAEGPVTEYEASELLTRCRAAQAGYLCESFEPIVAVGPHAASPHYRTPEVGSAPIQGDTLLLIDSGGHFDIGTTDTTRMTAVGRPSRRILAASTRVLQGMLALARTRFPAHLPAAALEGIARGPLWAKGLDFGHGTGHGIGYAQSVHEGPCRISWRCAEPLCVGNVVSDEPGYYEADAFGIRWENMLAVRADEAHPGFLAFEVLTRLPLDRSAFLPDLLTDEEVEQIDEYHRSCREDLLGAPISERARAWVVRLTEPLRKEK